jgi:hypothetical protein
LRRLVRSIRNFLSLASESMAEVVGVVVGGLRRPAGRYITDTGEAQLKNLGATFISHVGNGYDPLLERFVGQKMVFEVVEEEEIHEHVGIFKQYSPDFFEILDVQFPERQALEIDGAGQATSAHVIVTKEGKCLRVVNQSRQLILLQSLQIGTEEESLNVVVDVGEQVELYPETEFAGARLSFRVTRELDMILPRNRCVVRHRAEFYRAEVLPSIVFDLGIKLRGGNKEVIREARLRQQLADNPNAVLALSNLGGLLLQRQQYAEAQRLLEQAWRLRFSLPDNGRRTQLLLQELARKQNEAPRYRVEAASSLLAAGGAYSMDTEGGL